MQEITFVARPIQACSSLIINILSNYNLLYIFKKKICESLCQNVAEQ